jgi:hypothetical protein
MPAFSSRALTLLSVLTLARPGMALGLGWTVEILNTISHEVKTYAPPDAESLTLTLPGTAWSCTVDAEHRIEGAATRAVRCQRPDGATLDGKAGYISSGEYDQPFCVILGQARTSRGRPVEGKLQAQFRFCLKWQK